MPLYHIILLALIQGITEFLPISSSGHLVLYHALTDDGAAAGAWDENVLLDVAVHVGTLFSVLVYFWRDIWAMARGVLDIVRGRMEQPGARLGLFVLIGSIPVIAAGFIIHFIKPDILRALEVMAWSTLIFGIVLWAVDEKAPKARDLASMGFKDAILIGLSQILALIPGTSRSGITMIMARGLGFSRGEAARFSLLLAIVAISGAGVLGGKDVLESGDFELAADAVIAVFLSFISGLAAIALMMKWLEKSTFRPFAIYRIILGIALLGLIYSGVLL